MEVQGHLIDSLILSKILDAIMERGGDFEFQEFRVGRKRADHSYARIVIWGENQKHLDSILSEVTRYGATLTETPEVSYEPAPADSVLPEDFYCTTNHPTWVYLGDQWIPVEDLMMDKQIIVDPEKPRAFCKPIANVKKGDLVVVGDKGIRIQPPERPRHSKGVFEFMNSDVSPERPSTSIIKEIARNLFEQASNGGKIVVVAGPAVVHTGAAPHLARMVELGYVDALLTGNALAVHDIEYALFGTSLGVDLETSRVVNPRNHIAAINRVMRAGSIENLVRSGELRRGIFYQMVKQGKPFVLAGSIRDDGPLPEVVKCSQEAQKLYREQVKDAKIVIMLASTLHSIAVGNMLTSEVKTVCVDINPAVVVKLSDRGTSHAVGLVTDVGSFLPLLVQELEALSTQTTKDRPRKY